MRELTNQTKLKELSEGLQSDHELDVEQAKDEKMQVYHLFHFKGFKVLRYLRLSGEEIRHKFRSVFQASAVKDPFVKISANCSFVPTYLTKMPGSFLILSKSQSKSTR